ncbi:hypothetical protein JCM6882_006354 [Rhodosporidiobolus microsporus]
MAGGEAGPPHLGGSIGVAATGAGDRAAAASSTSRPLPPPIVTDFAHTGEGQAKEAKRIDKGKEKEREQAREKERRRHDEGGAPLSPRTSAKSSASTHSSPGKTHRRYKHHEPAPRRLLKRLNSLFHPHSSTPSSPTTSGKNHHKHQHQHTHSLPASLGGSSVALARGDSTASSRFPRSPLTAEPESLPLSTHPSQSPSAAAAATATTPAAPGTGFGPHERLRPSLKVRICTFNMHDSLPSTEGDLSDFLGDVGAFPHEFMRHPRTTAKKRMSSHSSFGGRSGHSTATTSRGSVLTLPLSSSFSHSSHNPSSAPSPHAADPTEESDDSALPAFPLTPGHPYHVLVVCGQECPTASGVFAGKMRTLDGKGWTSMLENYLCGGCDDEDGEEGSGSGSESSSSGEEEGECESDEGEKEEGEEGEGTAGGGRGGDEGSSPPHPAAPSADSPPPPPHSQHSSPSSAPAPPPSLSARARATSLSAPASRAPSALSTHPPASSAAGARQPRQRRRPRGPYILVEKERLLGIYCAVFVARCCEDLVEGVSKGRVTAGLIGGRVGNKGGVGISLLLASHRLLFVSAHLAAHASGLEIRKANALKILEEMDVDDFWEQSGKVGPKPRELSERFDQTFFMGDLNFRLSISRLHADWLIRGKDFVTALRFDQLRAVLAEANGVFRGFAEGEITFPPTYKYDLPFKVRKKRSTILGKRAGGSKKARDRAGSTAKATPILDFSVAEAEQASASGSLTDPEVSHSTSSAARHDEDDSLSVISSVGTVSSLSLSLIPSNTGGISTPTSPTTASASYEFDPHLTRSPSSVPKSSLASLGLPTPPSKGNETSMDAVRKAQVRFLTLVKSNSAAAAIRHAQDRALAREAREKGEKGGEKDKGAGRARLASLFPPRPILQTSQSAVVLPSSGSSPLLASSAPGSGGESSADERPLPDGVVTAGTTDDDEVVVEAKFDSSAKQRVQSYTDRILFKSTVVPPPPSASSDSESDDEDEDDDETEGDPDSEDDERHPTTANGFDLRSRRSTNFAAALRRGLTRHSSSSSSSSGDESDGEGPRRLRFGRTKSLQPRAHSSSRRGSTAGASMRTSGSAETHPPRGQAAAGAGAGAGGESGAGPSFWKRVRSLKDLASLPSATSVGSGSADGGGGSAPPSIASPLQSPGLSTAATTPTTPTFALPPPASSGTATPPHQRRTPRKKFTLSSPPSSPEDSRAPSLAAAGPARPPFTQSASDTLTSASTSAATSAPTSTLSTPAADEPDRQLSSSSRGLHVAFPRSITGPAGPSSAAAPASSSRAHRSGHSHSASSASLNTRFKSFLNLLPLPFLSTNSSSSLVPSSSRNLSAKKPAKPPKIVKVGPREGEVQVLKYDAVRDLKRMGAVSDHLPVFGVYAVGLGRRKRDEEEEEGDV